MFYQNENCEKIIRQAKSPYHDYCLGYPGSGYYFTGFMMGSSATPLKFTHEGSGMLDQINAYDLAEVNDTYLGQVNMITVSSFCGPQGLIWGYDVARTATADPSEILSPGIFGKYEGIEILNGANLRAATRALWGTKGDLHYPFLPGSHVFAASKFLSHQGPAILYGAFAVGIPEDRANDACLFMEDVGTIVALYNPFFKEDYSSYKTKIIENIIDSVLQIGENQGVRYATIYADLITQKVGANEIGGVLVASPYFLLAQNAYSAPDHLAETLDEWKAGALA